MGVGALKQVITIKKAPTVNTARANFFIKKFNYSTTIFLLETVVPDLILAR